MDSQGEITKIVPTPLKLNLKLMKLPAEDTVILDSEWLILNETQVHLHTLRGQRPTKMGIFHADGPFQAAEASSPPLLTY
ncbi:hypothetical protein N7528_001447 [Penicillium herquei]|nr:hypothetical protein N7528_001447 [Penicillium herquei]